MDEQEKDMANLIEQAKELCHGWIRNGQAEKGKVLLGVLMFGHYDLQIELARWLARPGHESALQIAGYKADIDADLMALRMEGVK